MNINPKHLSNRAAASVTTGGPISSTPLAGTTSPSSLSEKAKVPMADPSVEAMNSVVGALRKYQHYASSRPAMKLITFTGKKITFTGSKFITDDQEIINYLDDEIALGLRVIIKGELLTSVEADPMEALKKKIIEEYEDKKAKEAANASRGIIPNMGISKAEGAAKINPLGSDGVAS